MSRGPTDHAPAFGLPGVDGRVHTLESYGDAEILCTVEWLR